MIRVFIVIAVGAAAAARWVCYVLCYVLRYSEKDRLSDIPQMKMYMDKFKSAQAEHASLADHVNLASFTSALTQMPWFQQQWQVGLQRRARWEVAL